MNNNVRNCDARYIRIVTQQYQLLNRLYLIERIKYTLRMDTQEHTRRVFWAENYFMYEENNAQDLS